MNTTGTARTAGQRTGLAIPAPTTGNGMSAVEVRRWHDDQRILNADPRTAGSANRPSRLVDRVLRDARGVR